MVEALEQARSARRTISTGGSSSANARSSARRCARRGLTTTPRKSHSHILQTPSITTTHNKEAEVFIGETRPVISGTTTSTVNADTSSSTVTQQEIGVRLTILPLIGSD